MQTVQKDIYILILRWAYQNVLSSSADIVISTMQDWFNPVLSIQVPHSLRRYGLLTALRRNCNSTRYTPRTCAIAFLHISLFLPWIRLIEKFPEHLMVL